MSFPPPSPNGAAPDTAAAPETIGARNGAALHGKRVHFPSDEPLVTDGGRAIAPLTIAYETYGALNEDKSNAILLCHALTGDQYAAGVHPVTGKPGWWEVLVGPGRPFDTDRYFVISSNVVGGCMGTTGPASINPATRPPLRPRLSGRDDPRHGARAGDADRPSRH